MQYGTTYKSQVPDAGDVRGMRAVQVAARKLVRMQAVQVPGRQHAADQFAVFLVRTVAPMHPLWTGAQGNLLDPAAQFGWGHCRRMESVGCGRHACLAIGRADYKQASPDVAETA
jgi:hypothetical protein